MPSKDIDRRLLYIYIKLFFKPILKTRLRMNIRFLFMVGVWLSCISFSRANIPNHYMYYQVASREPVKGTVIGADGTPIAGATVKSLSTKQTTTTNEKGEFALPATKDQKLIITLLRSNI